VTGSRLAGPVLGVSPVAVAARWQSERMTGLARSVAVLLALAVGACTLLPWALDHNAWQLALSSLTSAGVHLTSSTISSLGTAVSASAVLVLLAALVNSRALLIVGALLVIAIPVLWILLNAVDSAKGVHLANVQVGAYSTVVAGFIALVLAALATDSSTPHVR